MRGLIAWLLFVVGVLFVLIDLFGFHRFGGLALLGVALVVGWGFFIGAHRAAFWVGDDVAPDDLDRLDRLARGIER